MDVRYNTFHSNSKKVWYIDGVSFLSDKGTNNGKQKAIAYARENLLDEKDVKKFDSEMEFKRFLYLKKKEDEGKIQLLKDHYNFLLFPSFVSAVGIEHAECVYEADFYYYDNEKKHYVVEDVKGVLEDVFRLKWKIFDKVFHHKNLGIVCVRIRSGRGVDPLLDSSWYEFSENQAPKKTVSRLREENKRLKEEVKKKEMQERKITKEKLRLAELKAKKKLTSSERKRMMELMEKYD